MNKIVEYLKRLRVVSKKYNKPFIWLLFHMLYWYVRIGATLTDYLNYQFYLKKAKEIKTYAVVGTQKKFYAIVSPEEHKKFFTIKPNFLSNFKKYVGRNWYVPESGINKLKSFIKGKEYIVVKPIDGLGGYGVKKIKVSDIKNINDFYNNLLNNRLFVEDLIIQNKEMNKLCDKSVNTIRVMTFVHRKKVEILYAGVRIGNGKSAVDNFHSGGMGVAVNLENGKLMGNALDKDLNEYKVHPLSKTKFDGFQIPYWKDIVNLVKEAALINTKIKVVGWDVAISENGPIFVEGNRRPGFDLVQVSLRRGRKDIIDYVLKKIK